MEHDLNLAGTARKQWRAGTFVGLDREVLAGNILVKLIGAECDLLVTVMVSGVLTCVTATLPKSC